MDVKWSNDHCDHKECLCDMIVKSKVVDVGEIRIARRYKFAIRTNTEMYFHALANLESLISIYQSKIVRVDRDKELMYSRMRVSTVTSPNQRALRPYFNHPVRPAESHLDLPSKTYEKILKLWDCSMFRKCGVPVNLHETFQASITGTPGVPWKNEGVPSLKVLAARAASTFNQVFGGSSVGPNTVKSTDNLYPEKIAAVYEKWRAPVQGDTLPPRKLARSMPLALDMLYDFIGTRKYFGKFKFKWNRSSVEEAPNLTSAGIRAGPTRVTVKNGIKYKSIVNGLKWDQKEYATKEMQKMLDESRNGRPELRDRAFSAVTKGEIFNRSGDPDGKDYDKKCRLYLIGSTTGYALESYLCDLRQKIERGDAIRIGMNWWAGGAKKLYDIMAPNGDPENYVYSDADFRAFDMTVDRRLLEIYFAHSGVYYDFDAMEKVRYDKLLKEAVEWITCRITHIMGEEWKLFMGGMPSGCFSTSHGNSWKVLLLFCWYLSDIFYSYPHYRSLIRHLVASREIFAIVFGDDRVSKVPRKNKELFNEYKFAQWLKYYWGMELRQIRVDIPLVSVPNTTTGEFICKGVVFLQRTLIHTPDEMKILHPNMPTIVPYRGMNKYPWKVIFGSDGGCREHIDVLLSCIGNAYDTYGTNKTAYEFIKFVYSHVLNKMGKDWDSICSEALKRAEDRNDKNFQKLVRKNNISRDELMSGFPSLYYLQMKNVTEKIHDGKLVPERYQDLI